MMARFEYYPAVCWGRLGKTMRRLSGYSVSQLRFRLVSCRVEVRKVSSLELSCPTEVCYILNNLLVYWPYLEYSHMFI
jgi:hypothetical protein